MTKDLRFYSELGSGGGHNAYYTKAHFQLTLTDASEQVLDVSRQLNPECEHITGDMRSLQLQRQFDAVQPDAVAQRPQDQVLGQLAIARDVHDARTLSILTRERQQTIGEVGGCGRGIQDLACFAAIMAIQQQLRVGLFSGSNHTFAASRLPVESQHENAHPATAAARAL